MKKLFTVIAIALLAGFAAQAQNNMGIGTPTPHASAALDVTSTTQGMLVPRMDSAQRSQIATPATGLLVYQTNGVTPGFYFYNGTTWTSLSGGGGTSLPSQTGNAGKFLTTNGTNLSWGTANTYELYVTKTATEAQTTSVGSSLVLPDVISFSNTSADPANAPLTGSGTIVSSSNGTWIGSQGRFTATNAGLYLVDVQLVSNTVGGIPMLDMNGTGNSGFSIYGLGQIYSPTGQTPHKGRGQLQKVLYLNVNDYFVVRGLSTSTAAGVDLQTDGSTTLKVVRLR